MSTQDTLVALLVLGALAVVGYTLLQRQAQTLPAPPPAMPTPYPGTGQPPIVEEDVVPPPNRPGFGYRYRDPCEIWPWLCP